MRIILIPCLFLPVESIANESCNEQFAARMVGLQLSVAEYLVQASGGVGKEVKSHDPETEGYIEDCL